MGKCYLWHINGCSLVLLPEGCAAEDPVYKIAFQAALHHTAFFCIGPCVCANVLRSKETSRWKEPPILTKWGGSFFKNQDGLSWVKLTYKARWSVLFTFWGKKKPHLWFKKKKRKKQMSRLVKNCQIFQCGRHLMFCKTTISILCIYDSAAHTRYAANLILHLCNYPKFRLALRILCAKRVQFQNKTIV